MGSNSFRIRATLSALLLSILLMTTTVSLPALVAALKAEGCDVLEKTEDSEYGKFAWVMDLEGHKVELWEPPPGQ